MSDLPVLPTLDAHAHLKHTHSATALSSCGAVFAMTVSLDEASHAVNRDDQTILWGVGCHPGDVIAQQSFDEHTFRRLITHTPIVGEIGLDRKSQVPIDAQLKTFRTILAIVSDNPRLVSIHSNHATAEVLEELHRQPISIAVLHWWNGSVSRTKAAVELGCYFSINPAIAQYSRFSQHVPADHILLETDHGYDEPPADIPNLIESTERIVSEKYLMDSATLRRIEWNNFRTLVQALDATSLLTESLRNFLQLTQRPELDA
jgi:TatD DNase family protein